MRRSTFRKAVAAALVGRGAEKRLWGAKWGANIHTHRRTVTDMSGTQTLKSEGFWTVTNTNGRF